MKLFYFQCIFSYSLKCQIFNMHIYIYIDRLILWNYCQLIFIRKLTLEKKLSDWWKKTEGIGYKIFLSCCTEFTHPSLCHRLAPATALVMGYNWGLETLLWHRIASLRPQIDTVSRAIPAEPCLPEQLCTIDKWSNKSVVMQ